MKKVSILIVDDDEEDRYLLMRDLEEAGIEFNLFERSNGQEALAFFLEYEAQRAKFGDQYPPILVFLDINMPKMNGLHFLAEFEKMRGRFPLELTVFMMFTSSERENDRCDSLAYSFVRGYVVKGELTPEALREKIEAALAAPN